METVFYKVSSELGFDNPSVEKLTGDASTRQYYRLINKDDSVILMLNGDAIKPDDPNLLAIKAFRSMGISVPAIYKIMHKEGVLVQEDLGNKHLELVDEARELEKLYPDIIKILIKFQKLARERFLSGERFYPLNSSFTSDKFLSELRMTSKYYLGLYRPIKPTDKENITLEAFYKQLVSKMMKQESLLQHRDYHSRNIMLKDGKIFLIDLQDARMGPFTYDLASLLIDPYISLSDELIQSCLKHYYAGIKDLIRLSYEDFLEFYNLSYLQRAIKILGTFSYQSLERSNNSYIKYIPITLAKMRKSLYDFPEWREAINIFLSGDMC